MAKRKTPAGRKTKTARKPVNRARKAARKAVGRKTARKAAARKAVRKAVAKKAVRKATAKKTVRKTVAKKAVARKVVVKKVTAQVAVAPPAPKPVPKAAPPVARKAPAPKPKPAPAPAPAAPVVTAPAAPPPAPAATPAAAPPAAGTDEAGPTEDDEEPLVPGAPSSLLPGRRAGGVRAVASPEDELAAEFDEDGGLRAGDLDVNLEQAFSSGDETPGGDNPTPDQDVVDLIGRSLGIEYDDAEELRGAEKVADRDRRRWELDPASADDFKERKR
jgi:hypothetical protein